MCDRVVVGVGVYLKIGLLSLSRSFLRWWLVIVVGVGLLCDGSVEVGRRMRSRQSVGLDGRCGRVGRSAVARVCPP